MLIPEETEPEDDRTYLENITRDAFGKDRGLSKGSNKAFTWAVINSFLGLLYKFTLGSKDRQNFYGRLHSK